LTAVLALSTVVVASDMALYVGAPNVDGWYSVAGVTKDAATIVDRTGHLFKDVQKFGDNDFAAFGEWVDKNTDDGELDIIWLNGCVPSVLYPFPNLQPDGSRIEKWLDGGNMIINVGDWFAYCSYEGGSRRADNGANGAANILDLSAGIIVSADNTTLTVTADGHKYLPSLPATVVTYRPVVPSAVVAPWKVAAVFAQNAAGTQADPIVIHNTVTNGYVAFINQSAGGGPPGWLADRGLTCAEFIINWVNTVIGLSNPSLAADPIPADGAVDVPQDTTIAWTPGQYAATHDVYFGTSFADVNAAGRADAKGGLVSQGQAAAEFDPDGLLEFGRTYYWRIDEVNGAPDNTIFKGQTWSFTVEPFSYPIQGVTATASSQSRADTGPQNTVNGSGLNAEDQHSVELTQMWMSNNNKPHWIQYQFDKVYKLDELWVWNANQIVEAFVGFGAKDVTIEYSVDGAVWTTLGGPHEFARAPGVATYAANTVVDLGGVNAKFVKLTISSNWGGVAQTVSLSEVRFFYVPVQAREPQPADAAVDVALTASMNWRPGREATSHQVFFGTDSASVAAGSVPAQAVIEHSYTPASLNFGTKYFWKVDEVGDAGTYAGDVWSFTTQQYAAIDDFEAYTDDEGNRIYEFWTDGVTNSVFGGSTVGYMQAPFAEKTIKNSGGQSMPLSYDNAASPFLSEAELAFGTAQNWTPNGAESLVVYFRGQAPGFAETADGQIIMSGIGADIWGASDAFRLAYKTLTGDATIVARVESIANSNAWAKGGVMIRQSTEPGSQHAFMPITPSGGNGASFQHRLVAAGASTNNDNTGAAVAAPYWVKLERKGNAFTGSISPDGVTWTQLGTAVTVPMTGPVLIGLALCSHDAAIPTSAVFSNLKTTGNVTGSWQHAEIGVAQPVGNSIEGLYLSVKDSAGKTKVVQHPGAAATATVTWQQWKIPLSEFTAAGVKMNAVKSLVIGVGNKTAPVKGGSGIVYIDDIGYGRSAQ
jgi:hypothetical protein